MEIKVKEVKTRVSDVRPSNDTFEDIIRPEDAMCTV
jgi:hypothetical protein